MWKIRLKDSPVGIVVFCQMNSVWTVNFFFIYVFLIIRSLLVYLMLGEILRAGLQSQSDFSLLFAPLPPV